MPKELPARPNLDHLKNQAKELLKAHSARDPSVCERLRSLNRFKGKSDVEILAAELPLQDAQFVLAMEYGFSGWNELKQRVEAAGRGREVMGNTEGEDKLKEQIEAQIRARISGAGAVARIEGINDLGLLNAYSIQRLMGELKLEELVALLKAMPGEARERFLVNLSAKRRAEVAREMEAGGGKAGEAGAARALDIARKALAEGAYALRTEEEERKEREATRDAGILREFSAGPTSRKSAAELLRLFLLLASKARAEGVIAIDRAVEGRVDDPLMKLGLEMAVDYVALNKPDDFAAAMQAKKKEMLAEYGKRLDLIILGTGGIGTGMNPSLMEERGRPLA